LGTFLSLHARHHEADFLLIGLTGLHHINQFAAVHDSNPVGKIEDLIQFKGNQQDCMAFVPMGYKLRVYVFMAPTSRPRVG
jgi:hypothetical protein